MRRFRSHDQPSFFWAKLTLWSGALSLIPLVGPACALLAGLAGATGAILQKRRPARYGGRPLLLAGLALAGLGGALFHVEMGLFLKWKVRQADAQRAALTQVRMAEWAGALEGHRIDAGYYPDLTGLALLRDDLVPTFAKGLSLTDGWDRCFKLENDPWGYRLTLMAPPPDGSPAPPPRSALFPVEPPKGPAIGPPLPDFMMPNWPRE